MSDKDTAPATPLYSSTHDADDFDATLARRRREAGLPVTELAPGESEMFGKFKQDPR